MSSLTFVLVSGMSGSGKSTAIKALEDIGYYCVDNLPPVLIPKLVPLCLGNDEIAKLAVGIDSRAGRFSQELSGAIDGLTSHDGVRVELLFLESNDEVILRRYKETRRKHPLEERGMSLAEAISRERALLAPLKAKSTYQVDTSMLNVHQLKRVVQGFFGDVGVTTMTTTVMSFGFKHGPPDEADFVFDVRFLPNPYFVEELRDLTGLDAPVQAYLEDKPETATIIGKLSDLLRFVVPQCQAEGKARLTVAVGCTGGKHRSVYVAEALMKAIEGLKVQVGIVHRDREL